MRYVVYNWMTGQRAGQYARYVDAFNAARAMGAGWRVREI